MRHSTIDLTMNVYTDPKLLDVYGALDSLPSLDLDTSPSTERQTMRATGTDDRDAVADSRHSVTTFARVCTKLWQTGAIDVVCCHLIG